MNQKSRYIVAFTVLITGIIISILLQIDINNTKLIKKERGIIEFVDDETHNFQHQISEIFSNIVLIKYLFEEQPNLTRKDFREYTLPLLKTRTSLAALSWVPKIEHKNRQAFESTLQNDLQNPHVVITKRDSKNQLICEEKETFYFPVKYIEPVDPNRTAIGYDIYSNEIRKDALIRAIQTNDFVITQKIKLVQDSSLYSFLALIPVHFLKHKKSDSTNIDGLISAIFKVDAFVKNIIKLTSNKEINLLIYDFTQGKADIIYGDKQLLNKKMILLKRNIKIGTRKWELNFIIPREYYKITSTYNYLIIGVLVTFFFFLVLIFPLLKDARNKNLEETLTNEKSKRIETEKSLSESEEYNRTLFLESTAGLLLNSMDGKFIDANPALCKMLGRTLDEILNLTYWDITPQKFKSEEEIQLKNLAETGFYGPYEKEYIHKDGHLISVRLQGKIIERNQIKYIWSSIEDITERINYEKIILNERNIAQQYMNVAGVMLAILNPDGQILLINKKGCEILGYDNDSELIGADWFNTCLPQNNRNEVHKVFHQLMRGNMKPTEYFENIVQTKSGKERIIAFHNTILSDSDGKISGVIFSGDDITERKKTEQDLHESEEKFRLAFKTSPDSININKLDSGEYIDINEGFTNLSGYTAEDVIGKTSTEIKIWKYKEDREKLVQGLKENGKVENLEAVFLKKNGHPVIGLMSACIIPINNKAHIISITRDITKIKEAQTRLQESELKFRGAFENSAVGMSLTKPNGEFLQVNNRFCDFLGYTNEELLNLTFQKITYVDDLDISINLVEKAVDKRMDIFHLEKRYVRKNGEIVWAEVATKLLRDETNKPTYFIAHIIDITERKNSEEKIKLLNENLEQQVLDRTAKLELANKELEAFSYSVSHDLRAPLRGIDGFSLALYEDFYEKLDDTAKDYISRIRLGTKKMDELIDSLLNLSRVSRFEMKIEKVNLSEVVQQIANSLKETDITRLVNFNIQKNIYVFGDSNLLRILVENLLNNAWKFTSKKEIAHIEFGSETINSTSTCFIKDNGIGFDMKYVSKLFTAFQRLHSEKEFSGTGVGLTTVQRIIHRHNGKIWVESVPNQGTTFYFNL